MSPKKRDYKNTMRGQCPKWDVDMEKYSVAEFVFSSSLHKTVESTSVGEAKRKAVLATWDSSSRVRTAAAGVETVTRC